ncbi:MAG: ABC transporter ATP-binding protein [Clostridia bacterium]|nr:ABC transporter ATP-binding protein [Clostridia bacterium]
MIKIEGITKKFDKFTALSNLNCEIQDGCIYGLVGSNGAGKSTLLRLIMGIYTPDEGHILIDDVDVHKHPESKDRLIFIPDELFFIPQANMKSMAKFYANMYPKFDMERFAHLTEVFGLDPKKKLNAFSKGMRRQAAIILSLSCMADYVFLDETFDGIDPVIRNLIKKVIYADVCERKTTFVLTSHSLRELEDTCDQLALLHKGGIVFESNVENLKTSLFKVQVAFHGEYDKSVFDKTEIETVSFQKHGSVSVLIVRGDREKTAKLIQEMNPVLFEILPLSLEEVFVYEMDALGYEFNDVII